MKRLPVNLTLLMALIVIPQLTAGGWMRTYGGEWSDRGYWVEQTTDGGYIVSGFLSIEGEPIPIPYAYLVKTDSIGDTLWTRYWEYTEDFYAMSGRCVQQTSDGGYLLIGEESLHKYLWLLKTNENGDTVWLQIYDSDFEETGHCVRQTKDGGFIVVGETRVSGPKHVWLLKTDETGDTLWTRIYGGEQHSVGYSLDITSDGGYVIAGCRGKGVLLLKTDEQGDTLWSQTYEDGDTTFSDYGYCVEQTTNGGYIISGAANLHPMGAGCDPWLIKTDSAGDILWTRTFGTGPVYSVQQTSGGGYITTGQDSTNLYLLKMDSDGNLLWSRTFGEDASDEQGYCVRQTADGGYIITGYTESYATEGSNDVWLIKTDSLGYVAITEQPPVTPVTHPDWQITTSVGRKIVLRYADIPQGFHAAIFNVSGRKVDELHSALTSGTITWPVTHQSPGVYFIKIESPDNVRSQKVIIIK